VVSRVSNDIFKKTMFEANAGQMTFFNQLVEAQVLTDQAELATIPVKLEPKADEGISASSKILEYANVPIISRS